MTDEKVMGLAVQLGLGSRVTLYAGQDKYSGRDWYVDIEKVKPGLYRFTFRGIRNAALTRDITGRTIRRLGESYAEVTGIAGNVWATVARLIPPDELEMGD